MSVHCSFIVLLNFRKSKIGHKWPNFFFKPIFKFFFFFFFLVKIGLLRYFTMMKLWWEACSVTL